MARILGAPFVSKAAIMAGCAGDDAEQVPFEGMPDVPTVERLIAERDAALAEVARATRSNRSTLTEVLSGQRSVSHDLAYKLGALMNDAVADLLIAYQHAYDLQREQGKRDEYRRTIERRAPIGA